MAVQSGRHAAPALASGLGTDLAVPHICSQAGLANRQMLDRRLLQALQRCRADGTMLALLQVDLDKLGPAIDSQVDAEQWPGVVAGGILARCRTGDFVARTGEDRFVLLMSGLPSVGGRLRAREMADTVVADIRTAAAIHMPGMAVTASAGVACWSAEQAEPADVGMLLEQADLAMVIAKRAFKSRPVPTAMA